MTKKYLLGKSALASISFSLGGLIILILGITASKLWTVALGSVITVIGLIALVTSLYRLTNFHFIKLNNQVNELLEASGELPFLGTIDSSVQKAFQRYRAQSLRTDKPSKGNSPISRGEQDENRKDVSPAPKPPKVPGNTFRRTGPYYGVGPEYEFAQRFRDGSKYLETFALRSKSIRMRDVFARAATNMQFNYADLRNVFWGINSSHVNLDPALVKDWDYKSLLTLARTLSNQRFTPFDVNDASRFYKFVVDNWGIRALGARDIYIAAEIFAEIGDNRRAREFLQRPTIRQKDKVHFRLSKANLVNPTTQKLDSWEKWECEVNSLFEKHGLSGLKISKDGATPFDSLEAEEQESIETGKKVSVIIPSFCGSAHLRTTLNSLVHQSWKNLEIIVVDDSSPIDEFNKVSEICAGYPQVKLFRQAENGGAYLARNRGLSESSGDFVTVHDDDDWSHPEKIAIQVAHLEENPNVMANMSRHVRTTNNLNFGRINNNPSYSQPNFSSLMVRREVFSRIGGWAAVNRSADVEFRDRLVRVFGGTVPTIGSAPLSFTRVHGNSLTAGELSRGYVDPCRLFYLASYNQEHKNAAASELTAEKLKPAVPENMRPGKHRKHVDHYDVIFATDFRFPGGTTSLTLNEIVAAANTGMKVGLVQLDSPLNSASTPFSQKVLEVVKREDVAICSLNDRVTAELLVVRHPSVIQFADGLTSEIRARKGVLIVNTPPMYPTGIGQCFDFPQLKQTFENLFGIAPIIAPETGVTTRESYLLVGPNVLASEPWPGFINVDRFSIVQHDFGRKPTVGRHSRPQRQKWPDKDQTTIGLYTHNEIYNVTTLGGIKELSPELQEKLRSNSKVYEFGSIEVEEYLSSIDFWVYFHSKEWVESFGMSIAEAMACGLVVVLPKYLRKNFGDGAVYCEEKDVKDVIEKYWSDPKLYEQQSNRARQFVVAHYSEQAFIDRVSRILSPPDETIS